MSLLHGCEPLEPRLLLASVPDGFSDSEIVTGLTSPTAMEIAPDGRIFVAGQQGALSVVQNGRARTVLTIPNVNSVDERGFGGITIDPNFANNGWIYVYYTREAPGTIHNRLARYTINGSNQIVGAETVILDLPDINNAIYHMGGALHFGVDGKLYVAVGDHLDGPAAQRLDSLFGKILRINSNGSIPGDNPFYTQASGIFRSIWAMGLRNPFTFGIQPGTGRMYINDVGQEAWEELNEGAAGRNFGWSLNEGYFPPEEAPDLTPPLHYYPHQDGQCAITGGTFYKPASASFPSEFVGDYFFADLCAGWIHVIDPNDTSNVRSFASGLSFGVDLDVASDGSLYYLERGMDISTGRIGRIRFASVGAPSLSSQPQSQTVARSANVSFTVQANGSGTISYQWQKNGGDIAGANSATLSLSNVQQSASGSYLVVVSNAFGSISSAAATLSVVVGNAPRVTIDLPVAATQFRGGQIFNFSGHATDTEDGTLQPSRFTWQVDYHTGPVIRPFFAASTGISAGTFNIPDRTPYKAADVFYRVRLTVRDSSGLSTTVTRDLQPITAKITLRSNIGGSQVFLDGQPKNTPTSTIGIAGVKRLLTAPPTQLIGGVNYVFDGWSDGGDREHEISTPAGDTNYVARYRAAPSAAIKGLGMIIHNNRDRTGTLVARNVSTVDFDWGDGSPDPLIHPDTFFIRFRGKVQPQFSETYTFHARANDGVRLFVNGRLLIDQWNNSDGSELSGSIALVAGQKYDLRFDYLENTGTAFAQLMWSSPSTPRRVIPRSKLFSTILPQTLPATADAFVQGGAVSSTNFGARDTLLLKSAASESARREAYLKFDITSLNLDTIGTAKLRFFGRLEGEQDINVTTALYHAPGAKWGERSITWDNRPATANKALGTAVVSNDTNGWWEFDITSFLRGEKQAGRRIVTFALRNLTSSQVYTLLYSREAAAGGPQIVVSI